MTETLPDFEAIHGTSNIGRWLGLSRAGVQLLMQAGRIRTYVVAGRSCCDADELHRVKREESGIDRWENEGGPAYAVGGG